MTTMPSRTKPVNQVNAAPRSSQWTAFSMICDSTFLRVLASHIPATSPSFQPLRATTRPSQPFPPDPPTCGATAVLQ